MAIGYQKRVGEVFSTVGEGSTGELTYRPAFEIPHIISRSKPLPCGRGSVRIPSHDRKGVVLKLDVRSESRTLPQSRERRQRLRDRLEAHHHRRRLLLER